VTSPRGAALRRGVLAAAVGAVALLLAACGSGDPAPRSSGGSSVAGRITVFAAASLTGAFTTIGRQFEARHPGTEVTFSFGPSSGLAEQINQGAPADVFASASETNMHQVSSAGHAVRSTTFAANVLEIAVPHTNPAHVAGLADLARDDVKLALCQPQVPCGAVAATVFAKAGLTVMPVSYETDVKSVLSKVALDEVDAGLVYVTDVRAAGATVRGIPIPAGVNASTEYPISVVRGSQNGATARAFVDFVLSPQGEAVLTAAGFAAP
jgi:molybdate transport system substrate-binding protein